MKNLQTNFLMLHSEILTLERPSSLTAFASAMSLSMRHSLCVVPLCSFLQPDRALSTLVDALSLKPATLPLIRFSLVKLQPVRKSIFLGN